MQVGRREVAAVGSRTPGRSVPSGREDSAPAGSKFSPNSSISKGLECHYPPSALAPRNPFKNCSVLLGVRQCARFWLVLQLKVTYITTPNFHGPRGETGRETNKCDQQGDREMPKRTLDWIKLKVYLCL